MIEAIAWRLRTGSPWRDLPAEFRPWQTAWKRLARWTRDGTWKRLLRAVQADGDAAGQLDWVTTIDSSVVRSKQWRGLATRYDKHADNYRGALLLAAVVLWTGRTHQ